ncbi:hypothetical protein N7541_010869 [Penicillium brevicompactum]|uniref:Xylanolytic transcriptional activator regulatory domain-containing protein n=1 Tax=Penicillium brevicompactum TaxID=5074 RepID=A0A9W9QPR7_PENBR|nr:hypothetical protein N7541_010869 [Penicillium brevicompactum]
MIATAESLLEQEVQKLGGQSQPRAPSTDQVEQQYRSQDPQIGWILPSWLAGNLEPDQSTKLDEHDSEPRGKTKSPQDNSATLSDEFGRLVLDRNSGTSRYVNHRVLTGLADQVYHTLNGARSIVDSFKNKLAEHILTYQTKVKDIRDLFDGLSSPTPSEDDVSTPASAADREAESPFLFGYHSLASSLRYYHPSPTIAHLLLSVFEENVAPIIRIVFTSALRDLIQAAVTNPDELDKGSEALVFSVYFAAASSMTEEQCLGEMGETHAALTKRFRFAVEQALARAGFLHTRKLIVIQAAVLFLSCASHPRDAHFVWTMIAVVTRLGLGLGLHRDGVNFELSPYETEMRRRTWWYIYLLDVRTSESQATSPQIREGDYNTLLPLNINDEDLAPDMIETPKERIGFTDMTLTLVRCEILISHRKLVQISDPAVSVSTQQAILESRLIAVDECRQALDNRYVQHCDLGVPIQWVTATIARVALARLWLVSHFSLMTADGFQPDLWPEKCDVLILTAIEVLEFVYLLETHENTAQWSWLFQGYVQWQSFAFVLSELCVRPISTLADRAWMAVNRVYDRWNGPMSHGPGLMMRSLERLRARAATARERELTQSQMAAPIQQSLDDTYFGETRMPNQTAKLAEDLLAVETASLDIFRGIVHDIGI